MGYIREPKGVDFTIGEIPYTAEDAAVISAHIQAQKAKAAKKAAPQKSVAAKKQASKRTA